MLTNKKLMDIFVESKRDKSRVFREVLANVRGSDEEIHNITDNWVKRFLRRWKLAGSRAKMEKVEEGWLMQGFMVEDESPVRDPNSVSPSARAPLRPKITQSGRKRLPFGRLAITTKEKRCRKLSQQEKSMEKLLQSAEISAHHNNSPATAKVLEFLRTKGEVWASKMLDNERLVDNMDKPSVEDSLMLKTRLMLSKRKYQALEKFSKRFFGVRMLEPWAQIMKLRNEIIPVVEPPNWDRGYLFVEVKLRAMIANDVSRMAQIPDVKEKIKLLDDGTPGKIVNATLMIASGVDSATGFSHYDQKGLLGKDDSLLTEHMMSLKLVADGEDLWVNPNPQSDVFCHARSMRWVKEDDKLTRKIYEEFVEDVDDINKDPIILLIGTVQLRISVAYIYSLIDGKAANAIVLNGYTQACPLFGCFEGSNPLIGPHFYHSRLNWFEWLIRIAAQQQVEGHPAQASKEVQAKIRSISDDLEEAFKINVNRPQPGGKGSSNHGNTVRKALTDTDKLANILGINPELVENLKMISCLALSSKYLNAPKVQQLYSTIVYQLGQQFPDMKKLPPCVHKYSHMPQLIRGLPYPLSFVDEGGGEKCHKNYKFIRIHHTRKFSSEEGLMDLIKTSLAWTDVKMSHLEYYKKRTPRPSRAKQEFSHKMTFYYANTEDLEDETSDIDSASDFEESDEEF